MADKNFGIKQLNLISASGTPNVTSPNNLNLNAITVAISTDVSIGGQVTSNLIVGTGKSVGIGSTQPQATLTVNGTTQSQQLNVTGVSTFTGNTFVGSAITMYASTGIVSATSFSGSNTLKSRTIVSGATTSIVNNGIGNTNITGYKSYSLMKVGLSTVGWLRLYTDSASRTADASRSIGIDPAPGAGVIAEVITTGISTTQIITPFVMGGNLDEPASTTIYAAITNLSGVTTSISVNLTILQLEV